MVVKVKSGFPGVSFEWDDVKARSNFKKHGISFETASRVFSDANVLFQENHNFTGYERRDLAIGHVAGTGLIFVVHAIQDYADLEVIRIISARRASRRERDKYERGIRGAEA